VKLTGAQIFVECLKREGVEVLFGYPGGAVLPIYDELYKSNFNHILVRHEQGATHMADGYARSTGKTGVCLVTSGPGGTNTVTGICTSFMDSTPMIVFTGQVPTALIGNDAFQEADILGITRPIVKHSYLVYKVKDLAETIREAFYIASTGKPGPVLVDLPKDVLNDTTDFDGYAKQVTIDNYTANFKPNKGQVEKMADVVVEAEKPLFYVGGGAVSANASEELLTIAELTHIPVVMTLMGLGSFPSKHPLSLNMCGMHGSYAANMSMSHNDLLMATGSRFDDRVTGKLDEFAMNARSKQRVVHIDIDPSSISKNVRANIPVVGDIKDVLAILLEILKTKTSVNWKEKHEAWWKEIRDWQNQYPLRYSSSGDAIKPQYVIEEIDRQAYDQQVFYSTEVGQCQMWAAQYLNFKKNRTFVTSGGLGTMGFGFPAGLGIQAAYPDALVVDIAGDGSIQMNTQEMATAVQYKLPVKVAILNNGFLGMVRQWQEMFYDNRYSHTDMGFNPDFVKLAESYGGVGLRARTKEEVPEIIKEAFSIKKPVFMDFIVDREENVGPMVAPGASITNMVLL